FFARSDQRLLFRATRQGSCYAVINGLILIRHGDTARILRLNLNRLIACADNNRFARSSTSKQVITDTADEHSRAGNARYNQTTATSDRPIAIGLSSAAKIFLTLLYLRWMLTQFRNWCGLRTG